MIVHFVTMHMFFFPEYWWDMFGRKHCFTLMIRMLFHLFSAWQVTAGLEDSKRQVTAGTKLYGLLKSWATPVGPYPRIGWVYQTRLLGSSLCSACYEPTSGCQSCRWWGMVQVQFIYVLLLWFWLVTYQQPWHLGSDSVHLWKKLENCYNFLIITPTEIEITWHQCAYYWILRWIFFISSFVADSSRHYSLDLHD